MEVLHVPLVYRHSGDGIGAQDNLDMRMAQGNKWKNKFRTHNDSLDGGQGHVTATCS